MTRKAILHFQTRTCSNSWLRLPATRPLRAPIESRLRKALKEANDPDCNELLSAFQLGGLDELQNDASKNDPAQSLPERDHDE